MSLLQNLKKAVSNPLDAFSYLTWINHCYSQTWEDLILKHILHKEQWFYIDIWANHPVHYNNTYMLYKKWWSGINVEPNKKLIQKFQSKRPRDINLQVAWGSWGFLTFFEFSPDTMSTCDPEAAKKYEEMWLKKVWEYSIPVLWIKEIIETYAPWKEIDILSVDVEWYDLEVLHTNDRNQYKPNYIILETVEYSIDGTGKKLNTIYDPLFKERWYEKFADTYINTLYKKI
jgi:FkbM family methyltransferase